MIIQCEKCQTRFRLDDSRVTDKGVKVRCTRCKHVFTVQKETPTVSPFEHGGALTGFPPFAAQDEAPAATPEDQQCAPESVPGAPFDTEVSGETSAGGETADFSPVETSDFDDSAMPFESDELQSGGTVVGLAEEAGADAHPKEAPQGFDFSDIFETAEKTAPEAPSAAISADFTEPDEIASQDSSGESAALFPPEAPVEAQDKPVDVNIAESFQMRDSAADLPPLSIASRRRQSPVFGALVTVIAVLVILVLGYFGYSSFSTPSETAAPEAGKISLRAVKAAFVVNKEAGELLVVSGEALNEYSKPRAALQVKVTVFDDAGQSAVTRTAYCGNPLTKEQLESLPLDKINAVMANQFGDSLVNIEVASGRTIPFVVVLANLPKGARDFTVQSAGSTVATGKQP